MKKLYVTLLLFFLAMTVFIIPASADDFDNANFTGVNFDWHSGPAVSPSPVSGFNHYLIVYTSAGTWGVGDRDTVSYYFVNDYIDHIRLTINDGGCSNIQTYPVSATPYVGYRRHVSYGYSSTDGYTLLGDVENAVNSINLDFNSRISKRVCVFTDIPCFDQNGNLIGNSDTLPHLYFNYFMDGSGMWHHTLGTTASSLPNDISVSWYVVNGSVNTPSGAIYDTFTTNVLTEEYVHNNLSVFDYFRIAYDQYLTATGGVLGQNFSDNKGMIGVFDKTYEYYYVPYTSVNIERVSSFDIYDYWPFIHLKADSLTTSNKSSFCQLDMSKWRRNLNKGGIYDYNHVAIIALVTDGTTTKIFRHDFNVSDCYSCIDSNSNNGDIVQTDVPTPTNVNDFQSLADYLKEVSKNYNTNNIVNYNNFLNNLTAFPWANVVGTGVANGMLDFLPSLSGELDTIFSGLFDDYYVPDLSDIEAQVDADEQAFSDKFQWVKDIKDEISFIITTPLQDNYGEFTFTTDLDKWGVGEITIFDSEWISSDVRGTMKIVITTFCTIALLFYIFKTLPSTLGNMPSD